MKTLIARAFVSVLAASGFLVAALGFSNNPGVTQVTMKSEPPQSYVPGELLVKFKAGVSTALQSQSLASFGATEIAALSQPGWVHLSLPATVDVPHALAAFSADANVEVAQPNYLYHLLLMPNDANYGQQWALKNTGQTITSAPQPGTGATIVTNNPGLAGADLDIEPAWNHITDCSTVTVAVVDTGVNYNNQELAGNMWHSANTMSATPTYGWNFTPGGAASDPMDLMGHGTHVAGIIGAAGNNGAGTAGVCWKASIMAVRVFDAAGTATTATVTQGVNFAVTNGAKVINMSLGSSVFDQAFSDSITSAQTAGVVVVVAAGNAGANNDSGTTPTYPCNFTQANLICVAALDQAYQLATFSNFGTTSVDVGAPGTNVLNTWAGTSAQITDPLTAGWTSTTTTAGRGWGPATLAGFQLLADPLTWPLGLYNGNTDDRVYKAFNLAGASSASMQLFANINVVNGDHFRLAYKAAGGDPFAAGTVAFDVTNVATPTTPVAFFYGLALDISACISATCSVGAQLQSLAGPTAQGIALTQFSIETMTLNTTGQNTISGTSMATPHAVGVAAMVMAYNPADSYLDVVNAVKNGGRALASLAGRTTTGKAVDALGALAYINAPTGLTASVH